MGVLASSCFARASYAELDPATTQSAHEPYVFLVDRLFRDKLLENVIRFAKACYEHKIIIITSCYIYRMWIQDDYEKFIEDCKLA